MKTRFFATVVLLLAATFLGTSCSEGMAGTDELLDELKNAEKAAGCPVAGTVTEDEAAGLLFMYDEEKMARDVYTAFYKLYKIPVFNNISKSEQVHKTAVGNLISAFGLELYRPGYAGRICGSGNYQIIRGVDQNG